MAWLGAKARNTTLGRRGAASGRLDRLATSLSGTSNHQKCRSRPCPGWPPSTWEATRASTTCSNAMTVAKRGDCKVECDAPCALAAFARSWPSDAWLAAHTHALGHAPSYPVQLAPGPRIYKLKFLANAFAKLNFYCGSEFVSASTTTLAESNLVDMAAFLV